MKQHKKNDRPAAYPKPNETDQQLKNQPEYMDQEPNRVEKEISDVPDAPVKNDTPQRDDRTQKTAQKRRLMERDTETY